MMTNTIKKAMNGGTVRQCKRFLKLDVRNRVIAVEEARPREANAVVGNSVCNIINHQTLPFNILVSIKQYNIGKQIIFD